MHQCDKCLASFPTRYHLKKHNKDVCTKEFICDRCGMTLKNKITLKNHKKKHDSSTSTRYQCLQCTSFFTEKSNLDIHMRAVHLKIKGFACELCPKKFARATNLRCHVSTVHDNDRPYVCTKCGSRFGRLDALKRHSKSHSHDPDIECLYCGQKYNSTNSLNCHVRRHHPLQKEMVKSYCNQCKRCFKDIVVHESFIHKSRRNEKSEISDKIYKIPHLESSEKNNGPFLHES